MQGGAGGSSTCELHSVGIGTTLIERMLNRDISRICLVRMQVCDDSEPSTGDSITDEVDGAVE
jgi:hypothetical protein